MMIPQLRVRKESLPGEVMQGSLPLQRLADLLSPQRSEGYKEL